MFKKIVDVNKTMIANGRKDASLNPNEEALLQSLRESLDSSKPVPTGALDLVVRIITQWSYSERLPGLDLLRCLSKHHSVAQYSDPQIGSIIDLAIGASLPSNGGESPSENAVMMGARTIANLFLTADGRSAINSQTDKILSFLERISGSSPGQQPIGKFHRNLLIATTTVQVNLAVLINREKLLTPSQRRRLVSVIGRTLDEQTDSEVLYRGLVALGTTLTSTGDEAKGLGVRSWVQGALGRSSEDRVKGVAAECVKVASD